MKSPSSLALLSNSDIKSPSLPSFISFFNSCLLRELSKRFTAASILAWFPNGQRTHSTLAERKRRKYWSPSEGQAIGVKQLYVMCICC